MAARRCRRANRNKPKRVATSFVELVKNSSTLRRPFQLPGAHLGGFYGNPACKSRLGTHPKALTKPTATLSHSHLRPSLGRGTATAWFSVLELARCPRRASRGDIIQGNFIATDALGTGDITALGAEVSKYVHGLLGGPDTAPGTRGCVQRIRPKQSERDAGFWCGGQRVRASIPGTSGYGAPDGRTVSDFVHTLMETRAGLTAINSHSDRLMS